MPPNLVTPGLEKYWDKAKELAEKEGRGGDWAYVVGIFKRMTMNKSEAMEKSDLRTGPVHHVIARWPGAVPDRKGLEANLMLRRVNAWSTPRPEPQVTQIVPSAGYAVRNLGLDSQTEQQWIRYLENLVFPGVNEARVRQAVLEKMMSDRMDPALRSVMWARVQAFLKHVNGGERFEKSEGHKYKRRWRGHDGQWHYEYDEPKLITHNEVSVRLHPKIHGGGGGHEDMKFYVTDRKEGKVRVSRHDKSDSGVWMPKESLPHFQADLAGEVEGPPSDNPDIQAVLDGKAKFLGKGDDGLAFKVGDTVVKVSTTVPFQPENPGHRSPVDAAKMLREQSELGNKLADMGVKGVQRSKFVTHGDKGYQIKPWVELPEKFTREQLDAVQDIVIAIHKAGYTINDTIQPGLENGKPVLFDVGKAAPSRGKHDIESDMDMLGILYRDHGHTMVRKDIPKEQQHWEKTTKVLVPKLLAEGKFDTAQTMLNLAAKGQRKRAEAQGELEAQIFENDLEDAQFEIDFAREQAEGTSETKKSLSLVIDLQKAQPAVTFEDLLAKGAGHKYLRRWKNKKGEWEYDYGPQMGLGLRSRQPKVELDEQQIREDAHSAVRDEAIAAAKRAVGAGADPKTIKYVGAGMEGIIFEDKTGRAYKVKRKPKGASSAFKKERTMRNEAEALKSLEGTPAAKFVPKMHKYDEKNDVLVRDKVEGRPGGWGTRGLREAYEVIVAELKKRDWSAPEYKEDSFIVDESGQNPKMVDVGFVHPRGKREIAYVQRTLDAAQSKGDIDLLDVGFSIRNLVSEGHLSPDRARKMHGQITKHYGTEGLEIKQFNEDMEFTIKNREAALKKSLLVLDELGKPLMHVIADTLEKAATNDSVERTYKVRGHAEVIAQLDKLLLIANKLGEWGASRSVELSIDGDGPHYLSVDGVEGQLDKQSFKDWIDKDTIKAYGVELEKAAAADWDQLQKAAAKGGKYIRRVPYTDKHGKTKYRYFYKESAAARSAQAGEEIKLGQKVAKVIAVQKNGDVTIAWNGNKQTFAADAWHRELTTHYGEQFEKSAERRAKQTVNAVLRHVPRELLQDLKGETDAQRLEELKTRVPAVYAKLERAFQRAGMSPFEAKRVLSRTLERRGWQPEARAAAVGTVLTHRGTSITRLLDSSENLAGGDPVEPKHVAAATELGAAGKGEPLSEVKNLAAQAERDVAKLASMLQALQEGKGNAAELFAEAMASKAIQKLNMLAQAFPGLADRAVRPSQDILHEVAAETPRKPTREGAETVVYVAGEGGKPKALKARYRLVEADELIASHKPDTFAQREDYPTGVQERAYHRDKSEQAKVIRNAQRMDPRFVVNTNPDAVNGPPMVTGDGVVLGGNSRAMSMQRIYSAHPEKADEMRQYLTDHAHEVGFKPADIGALKNPVLIREVEVEDTSKRNLQVLVRQMNESFTQGMDPRTMQVAMGRRLDTDTLKTLANDLGEDETLASFLGSKRSERFVKALHRAGIIDDRNANQYTVKGTNQLNQDGVQLVSRILVGRTVQDADILSNTGPQMIEAVARAIPAMTQATAHGEGFDLGPDLAVAISAFNDLNQKVAQGVIRNLDPKMPGKDFTDLFNHFRTLPGIAEPHPVLQNERASKLLEVLVRRRGPTMMSKFARDYAAEAAKHPEGQATMFGAGKSPTEVLADVVDRALGKSATGPGPTEKLAASFVLVPEGDDILGKSFVVVNGEIRRLVG
jgi:hypothetical protein